MYVSSLYVEGYDLCEQWHASLSKFCQSSLLESPKVSFSSVHRWLHMSTTAEAPSKTLAWFDRSAKTLRCPSADMIHLFRICKTQLKGDSRVPNNSMVVLSDRHSPSHHRIA
jgi:hypothetical protein